MKPRLNTKAKGSRSEYEVRDFMLQNGQYHAHTRAAASLGTFDLVMIGTHHFHNALVQVKSNAWPRSEELRAIERFECPRDTLKVIARVDDQPGVGKKKSPPQFKIYTTIDAHSAWVSIEIGRCP